MSPEPPPWPFQILPRKHRRRRGGGDDQGSRAQGAKVHKGSKAQREKSTNAVVGWVKCQEGSADSVRKRYRLS